MTRPADVWIRRCSRCFTVDERGAWDEPEAAQADATLAEPVRWYRRRRIWRCQACGSHGFTVEPHDASLARNRVAER